MISMLTKFVIPAVSWARCLAALKVWSAATPRTEYSWLQHSGCTVVTHIVLVGLFF